MNVQAMFTEIAPTYDKLNRWLSFSSDKKWRDRAIAQLTAKLDMRVLDLCAGTCDMTLALLQRLPHATVTCVDFSQEMLDRGCEKIPHVFRPHVTVQCEDALSLSLTDGAVDTVMCAFGMRNLPDQSRALREIHRVLVPGGELAILEFFQPATWAAKTFAATYGRFIIPWLGGMISKRPTAYRYLHESTMGFYSLAAYRALLVTHGFTIRSVDQLSGGIANLILAVKS